MIDEVGAVGGGHHEDTFLGTIVHHAEQSRNLLRDVAILALAVGIGRNELNFIKAKHKRSLDFGGIEHPLQVVEHAVLIDMPHLHTLDDGIIEAQFFRKTLKHKAFATSRRTIKQHAVDGRQLVQLRLFGILKGKKHLLAQLFLQFVATRHIVEAAT